MTERPRRILVAINPTAAFGRSDGTGAAVTAELLALGHDAFEVQAADAAGLEAALTALLDAHDAAADGPDRIEAIVVVGGDGLVNLVVELLARRGALPSDIPIGIAPSGTGNDLGRTLAIGPATAAEAAGRIHAELARGSRLIDLGRVTTPDGRTRWFANSICLGFDALVNERANRLRRPRGPIRYQLAIAIELLRLRARDYTITVDGAELSGRYTLLTVANGRSIGGGLLVAPDAELDDGLFDVFLVEPVGRLAFLTLFPRVFKGTHVSDPRVRIVRASAVTVDSPGIVAYADGERFGPLPMTMEIVHGALRLLS